MAVPQSFPAKIYQILENESPDIIQWNENGVSFRIVDHGRFEREIVPKYFRRKYSNFHFSLSFLLMCVLCSTDNQISSVQRQLNLYGFKCISRGEFKRSFFHPKFRRGDWETVRKLTRFVPVKKNSQAPNDDMPGESAATPDDRKRDERTAPLPPMYNPYFYPIPGANMPGQPHADYLNRSYMMAAGGAAPGGVWPESWDRQESANNHARMMGMPAHFAYSMIPMHAAMQQHMSSAALHGVSSGSNLARLDAARSSDLSNRLGFKFNGNGLPMMPESHKSMDSSPSASSSTSVLNSASNNNTHNNTSDASSVALRTHSQEVPEHLQSHADDRHAHAAYAHAQQIQHVHAHALHPQQGLHGGSAAGDYDFSDFGMFDAVHEHQSQSQSQAQLQAPPLPQVAQVRLPTVVHELPRGETPSTSQRSSITSNTNISTSNNDSRSAPSPVPSSSHAHASVEVEASAAHQAEESSDRAKPAHSTSVSTSRSCDMACNTLLTYSKIHDALVYRQHDL